MYAPMPAGRFAQAVNEQIANEFGQAPKMVRIWGRNLLNEVYMVEKLWKGDGESDCAILVRVSTK